MSDQISEPLTDIQRLAQLLVAITVELGEPGDTLFNDLPRLVREKRARAAELLAERDEARMLAGAYIQVCEKLRGLLGVEASDGFRFALAPAVEVLLARVAELEAEAKTWKGMYRVASDHREQNLSDYRQARDDRDAARARVHEFRVYLAEIVDALGEPEDTRFDVLPESARTAGARTTELEAVLFGEVPSLLADHGITDLPPRLLYLLRQEVDQLMAARIHELWAAQQ